MPTYEIPVIVARISALLGEPAGDPVALDGGITNRNYRVAFGGRDYVVRLPGKDTDLLGIDRVAECNANDCAAELGVAPPVAVMLHEPPVIVTRFIEGRTMEPHDLREPTVVGQVAAALRAVHDSGVDLSTDFDSFRLVERYAEIAAERGAAIPPGYAAALERAHTVEAALRGDEHTPVPCHNDLLAANFVHDGRRLQIVDWEYAGMGNRYFDLANFAVNNSLDADGETALLEAYFDAPPDPGQLACLSLMRFMSDFREAMWGVVQSVVSELDFGFKAYAVEHFRRLERTAADPQFETWLEQARGASA
jgi:thiamine kinase-like enzyme